MIAGIYLRVSTDRQDERNQWPACAKLAAARGWETRVVTETGSGMRDRDGWAEIMNLARRGEIRAVVVWRLDRIDRRMFQLMRDVRELDRIGCVLVSVHETWVDTGGPFRDLVLAVFGWAAEHENRKLRENTRAGVARARAAGRVAGPRSQFGTDEIERARALKAEGNTWGQIAKTLKVTKGAIHAAATKRPA